jgi:predicted RNase H-like nuclease (RuvC/YqgF family)
MIPAYSEEVKIHVHEKDADFLPLEQQVRQLQEQFRILQESVEYMNRERARLKSDLDQLRNAINRSNNGS